ncbi:hypothetical protein MMAN_38840 [Mycobacterium mantenii]|uniref:PPE family C-terminal domain-containing protein n=1 Tax=Mycobacterium mantenii TaxID=560555 RepID=A0ABM7JW03_MYCNT|nr:hypothetical protein [Mycobacterium mantenii]MCV7246636.1 hypothetical protein [Mycobacterium mantenii]BBY39750.1 hypothetical protein MMAN_38840 [Mycobacterium mantenii]
MATLPAWVSQAPATFDMVAPLKSRASGVLHVMLKGKRRPATAGPRLMSRGVERC